MTTEIKPGKWRLKDGREVVVLWDSVDYGINLWVPEHKTVITREQGEFEGAEYIGPAVIGDGNPQNARDYWYKQCGNAIEYGNELEQHCNELEAEMVATRELLEKSEERCEELERNRADVEMQLRGERQRAAANSQHADAQQQAEIVRLRQITDEWAAELRRLKRGEFTEDEFQNLCHGMTEDDARRFKAGCFAYWPKLFGKQGVAYEFKDGVEIYRYKSVTVMVRGEREATCHPYDSRQARWTARQVGDPPYVVVKTREDAEAWCREQLEPRWREATEGDAGKACRVKDFEGQPWEHDRTLIGWNESIVGGPWATVSSSGSLSGWRYCEVQD